MASVLFREKQKIDSLWPLLVLAITLVVNWVVYFYYGYEDLSVLYKSMLVSGLAAAFLSIVRLETEITKDTIKFKLFPIHLKWKTIIRKDVKKSSLISVKPIKDFGGWGYRRIKDGKAYLVRGNEGVRFDLENGQHIFLGTQKLEECKKIL